MHPTLLDIQYSPKFSWVFNFENFQPFAKMSTKVLKLDTTVLALSLQEHRWMTSIGALVVSTLVVSTNTTSEH